MRHTYALEGYAYRLRPIRLEDAQFVIDVRLEDAGRNQYIHPISAERSIQERWLTDYLQREGDFYFVIENRFTGGKEGLIAFYDTKDGCAEWGRWVIRKGSLAAAESVYLLYRIAFEQAGLEELYCRTVAENAAVVSFHHSIGEKERCVHPKLFELNGQYFDAVEQYSGRQNFYESIAPGLEKRSAMVAERLLKQHAGPFEFHHIGIASKSIERELPVYTLMGYRKASAFFEDPEQGIRGLFLEAEGHPRLELLENLDGFHTLDPILMRGQKLYHTAYFVENLSSAAQLLTQNRAKPVSGEKYSVYFKKRICFFYLPNMNIIELMETGGADNP